MFWNSVMTFLWQCRCSSTWDFCFSGVYADKVGIEAAEMLLKNIRHNGCVDEFLQDQVSVRESDTHTLCDLTLTLLWLSSAAHYLHGAGKGNVSDSNWCCDTTHTDSNSHRRAADSGQKLLQHKTDPMVPFLFASHSSSFNIASLSCPGVWRSTSGLSRADQSLTLCAVVFAGKVHNNKGRRRAEQKHHLHHRMSRIRSGEPQPVAEHAVHTLTPRSVAAPNVADPLSFCLSGFFSINTVINKSPPCVHMFLPVFNCSKERFPIFPHVHFTFLVLWLLFDWKQIWDYAFWSVSSFVKFEFSLFSFENFHISIALIEIVAFCMRIKPSAKKGHCD